MKSVSKQLQAEFKELFNIELTSYVSYDQRSRSGVLEEFAHGSEYDQKLDIYFSEYGADTLTIHVYEKVNESCYNPDLVSLVDYDDPSYCCEYCCGESDYGDRELYEKARYLCTYTIDTALVDKVVTVVGYSSRQHLGLQEESRSILEAWAITKKEAEIACMHEKVEKERIEKEEQDKENEKKRLDMIIEEMDDGVWAA